METSRGFDQAFKELEKLVAEIEDENIQLDELADKVKEANTLIRYCETRLRSIADEIDVQKTGQDHLRG
jgi:exodeoxyribonuclease VII small subunit